MQLFFEEDGVFKAGHVMKKDGAAYQVELPTGRRTKVKGGHVFFEFEGDTLQAAADFLAEANQIASEMDPAFLWEVAPKEEFGYAEVAQDYFTEAGPRQKAGTLIALHSNPVYFYRKGRGQFKSAPEDILRRALEAVEKKRRLEERRQEMVRELVAGTVPEEIAKNVFTLLLHPDKNSIEWKALNDASAETRQSPLRLMLSVGAVKSPWQWHVQSFYQENFPRGTGFAAALQTPEAFMLDLPVVDVGAFSIDDSSTTEIDDAASVVDLGDGKSRIGIHIAAPALIVRRDSAMDAAARARMSTVYAPGLKTTMLPESWIQATSLDAGKVVPCVSLYATVDNETMAVLSTETRVERIRIAANLRYDKIESLVTEEAIVSGTLDIEYAREISFLWHFARARLAHRELMRGKPEPKGRIDWYFDLEGEGEEAIIHLKGRARGEPLDLLVAELMIFCNSTWGAWLEELGRAGIYRSQRMGRVRMSTIPGPHDGLGVERYAWSSSPLRRYVDMVNQRQIISAVLGEPPAYQAKDADLYTIVSQFEATYDTFNEFQRKMERYWSLRWIEQEGLQQIEAIVVKGDLIRIEGLPFSQRVPGMPELERGQKVRFAVLGCDFIDLVLELKLLEIMNETAEVDEEELETEENKEQDPGEQVQTPSGEEQSQPQPEVTA